MAYLGPIIVLVATAIMGGLAKIPGKLRPFIAVLAGIALQLRANGGLTDGLQVHDIVDGVLIGLTAVGLYSGAKNAKEYVQEKADIS